MPFAATASSMRNRLDGLLSFILPSHCPLCGAILRERNRGWCEGCETRMRLLGQGVCPECRRYRPTDDSPCPSGHDTPIPQVIVALGCFDDGWGRLVHAIKYDGYRSVTRPLGELLASRLVGGRYDVIIPVPTTLAKSRKRGFGHAEDIARVCATVTNIPCLVDGFTFTRAVADQTRLNAAQRALNLHEAFRVTQPGLVVNKRVLIVDDVMTTGATMLEAGRALTEAGAQHIAGAVVALNLHIQD